MIFCSDIPGKTTIADALVASNGIISPRLAGKVCWKPRQLQSTSENT